MLQIEKTTSKNGADCFREAQVATKFNDCIRPPNRFTE